MLSFPIPSPLDPKEAAVIDRRRAYEAQRRNRIFNSRERQYGVNIHTLEEQIAERKAREDAERRKAAAYEEKIIQESKLALLCEKSVQEERRRQLQEINSFRATCQRPQDSISYDLNCPERLRRSPAKDDVSDCGPSSAKIFGGEDRASVERRLEQQKQLKAWLDQQMREKEEAEAARQREEKAQECAAVALDKAAVELSRAEQECRRVQQEALVEFNKALMAEKEACQREKKRLELLDNQAEITNCITGDFLSENPEMATSAFGPHRLVADRWKGMSPEQRERIRKEQLQQALEAKMRREEERRRNSDWETCLNGMNRSAMLLERELDRKKREEKETLMSQNKMLSEEQRTRNQHLNKCIYTNVPSPAYFQQFNTTSR